MMTDKQFIVSVSKWALEFQRKDAKRALLEQALADAAMIVKIRSLIANCATADDPDAMGACISDIDALVNPR